MNNNWARRAGQTSALAAGALLVAGTGAAHADAVSHDNVGAGNGNQVIAPIQAPINICGNALAILGAANAGCVGGASATNNAETGGADLHSHDNVGLLNGNQVYLPVQAPVDISGNAGAAGGAANAYSTGGSSAVIEESGHVEESLHTHDNVGALSGNQAEVPVQIPINACGNAVAAGGAANASCEGGADATYNGSADLHSHDNVGLGNGNQLFAPIQVPINVCGNAIAVLGAANASCEGGSSAVINPPEEDGGKGDWDKGGKWDTHAWAEQSDVVEESLPLVGDLTSTVPGADIVDGLLGTGPQQPVVPANLVQGV
ncbi:chaplin family protein [Natronoglycomyces albus]|uniref:Chaplin n=1 Tax=Natronoglycomyces albus TaxID=2811108 RepID=A0A895XPJ4_9ACTN|nr:chaplin family protein [Natronoglycomyces albus]QSB05463.1 chaplin [Natronoglycomyces albus]